MSVRLFPLSCSKNTETRAGCFHPFLMRACDFLYGKGWEAGREFDISGYIAAGELKPQRRGFGRGGGGRGRGELGGVVQFVSK